MHKGLIVAAGALALCACGRGGAESEAADKAPAPAACASGDARLPGSGLCEKQATALMPPPERIWDEGNQCRWVLAETALPDKQWLLYRALACKQGVTRLEYRSSAEQADLRVASSAFGPQSLGAEPWIIARLIPARPDGIIAIRAFARAAITDPAEASGCDVRRAGFEGWPADSLVVDVSEAQAAKAPKDEPRTACGDYGLDEDTSSFWRVAGPYAVHFNLGQESALVDAGSFVVVTDAD